MNAIEINLLQKAPKPKSRNPILLPSLLGGLLVVFIVYAGISTMLANADIADMEEEISNVNAEIQQVQLTMQNNRFTSLFGKYSALPDQLRASFPAASEVLTRLQPYISTQMNVTEFEFLDQGTVKMKGSFTELEAFVTFIRSLENSGEFQVVHYSDLIKPDFSKDIEIEIDPETGLPLNDPFNTKLVVTSTIELQLMPKGGINNGGE
ncbi:hypothetical protein [Marinicrinis sediminis]|uniref:Pilus assembly protein PilO n=1 Tax=Marinicrinis sediminis TaxID=1652465 RepID=A0ABW5RBY8_9BACL